MKVTCSPCRALQGIVWMVGRLLKCLFLPIYHTDDTYLKWATLHISMVTLKTERW